MIAPLLRLIKESAPEVDPAEGEQMPRRDGPPFVVSNS